MASNYPNDPALGSGGVPPVRGSMGDRIKRLLTDPKTEWPRIDAEPMTVKGIMTGWAVPLAAIGPVATFLHAVLFGYGAFGVVFKPSIGAALATAVVSYVLSLVAVWLLSLVIDALAPTFGGVKSPVQAMKVAAFASTASWVAMIFWLVPYLGFLAILGLYSLYLLYLGLPRLMRAPEDKALVYTVATIVAAAVLVAIVNWASSQITAPLMAPAYAANDGTVSGTLAVPGVGTIDMGKLDAASKQMQAAAAQQEAAARAGAANATAAAGKPAIAPAALQALLPASVGGFTRTAVESSGGAAAGIGGSTAKGTYTQGTNSFELSVADVGAIGALATMGGAFTGESNKQTATGYEKSAMVGGNMTTEKWDATDHSGSYGTMVASRFMVQAEGTAPDIATLKGAVGQVNTGALAAMAK